MSGLLHICMGTVCVPGACRGQEQAAGPLELKLRLGAAVWVLGLKPGSYRRMTAVPSLQLHAVGFFSSLLRVARSLK